MIIRILNKRQYEESVIRCLVNLMMLKQIHQSSLKYRIRVFGEQWGVQAVENFLSVVRN